MPFPGDLVVAGIAVSMDDVSATLATASVAAAAVDADTNPRDPNKLVDFLVKASLARFGMTGPEAAEETKKIRSAATIVTEM